MNVETANPIVTSPLGKSTFSDSPASVLSQILHPPDVSAPSADSPRDQAALNHENQLIQARLGIAAALFQSLRAKHASTAAHSLRVAIGCSSWGLTLDLTDEQRDEIEVAALLHDVGKIGVPDHVLLKPSKLQGEELLTMERHRHFSQAILKSCCASQAVLDIVSYSGAWYNGARHGFDIHGERLPRGARMIAIVDAFDSMVTDSVYRRALSRERALAELFEYAGSQFDPVLVREFADHFAKDSVQLSASVCRRWLQQLKSQCPQMWASRELSVDPVGLPIDVSFHQKLIDSMHDGVFFVDQQYQITHWSRGAERLTGIAPAAVEKTIWDPTLIGLRDEHGKPISDVDDPISFAIRGGSQVIRRLEIASRNAAKLSVDMHIAPVLASDGLPRGATILMHDVSTQTTMERKLQTLHEKATQDPLTKVANRAEFDRMLNVFVVEHLQRTLPCSLIICDLDHFKKVNDTYGHPAGDAALIGFASILTRNCRTGDLVARYGGEEFVMLCADCDNAAATDRAEEIRRQLEATPQPALNGKNLTASFGVTESQGGDTAETMLRRADRALLQAKTNGRNMVVQLGTGITAGPDPAAKSGWFWRFRSAPAEQILERSLITAVPLKVAAEKLRGFVSDHHAEILTIEENRVVLQVDGTVPPLTRRATDRVIPFYIDLRLEENNDPNGKNGRILIRTVIRVSIRPKRHRDRRTRETDDRARQLLGSVKSYLMAQEWSGEQAGDSGDSSDCGTNRTKASVSSILK